MPPVLRRLIAAEAVSATGSNLSFVALPWLVLVSTGSATRMGAVLAAEMLPVALLGLAGGRVVAACGGRRTMVVADLVRAVAMAAIAALATFDVLWFPALLCLVAVVGACHTPSFAAQRTLAAELAGDDERLTSRAMTLLQGVTRGASLAGPAVGGLLLAPVGAHTLLAADAATFALSAGVVARLPVRGRLGGEPVPAIRDGLRAVWRTPLLRRIAATSTLTECAYQALFSALPAFVFVAHRDRPSLTGLLVAAWAGGALVGVPATLHLLARMPVLRLVRWAGLAQAAAVWPLAARLPPAGMAASLFLVGVGNALTVAPKQSLFMLAAPTGLRASATATLATLTMLAGPLGALAGGPLVQAAGAATAFALVAAAMSVAALAFALRR